MAGVFDRYILMILVQISVLLGRKILRKSVDSFSSKVFHANKRTTFFENPCFYTISSFRINLFFIFCKSKHHMRCATGKEKEGNKKTIISSFSTFSFYLNIYGSEKVSVFLASSSSHDGFALKEPTPKPALCVASQMERPSV